MDDEAVRIERLGLSVDVQVRIIWCNAEARAKWSNRIAECAQLSEGLVQESPACRMCVSTASAGAISLLQAALRTSGVERVGPQHVRVRGTPFTNGLLRPLGVFLTGHQACSFDCAKTIRQGQSNLGAARESQPELARDWLALLQMPCRWDILKGVGILHTALFKCEFPCEPVWPRVLLDFVADPQGGDAGRVSKLETRVSRLETYLNGERN